MDIWVLFAFCLFGGVVFSFRGRHHGRGYLGWVFYLVGMVLFGVHIVFSVAPAGFLAGLPGVMVEDSEFVSVESGGVVVLRSGVSGVVYDEFFLSPGVSVGDIAKFLDATHKPTYFYIKSGSDVLYVRNLGKLSGVDAEGVKEIYDRYMDEQLLPRSRTRYWIFRIIRVDV